MKITIPTAITLFRIGLIPLFVIVFYLPYPWADLAAAGIFAFASITDWVDGYLARALKQESSFGAFLDPVADKLMVVVAIVLIVERHPSIYIAIPSVIIVAREISVSALREWMAQLGSRAAVQVSFIGKAKTTTQLISILLMIYSEPYFDLPTFQIGLAGYYLAAFFTVVSMVQYLRAAWPVISKNG
jgi:CDP-diacylglycerol--glycerol-3-phosphate 3-phosphatidyltransferase